MAVHRSQIDKAHVLEEAARQKGLLHRRLDLVGEAVDMLPAGQGGHQPPVALLEAQVLGLEALVGQMLGHPAHVFGDGHAVIVENDDEGLSALAGVGQALVGQSPGEGTVPQQGDNAVVLPQLGPGPGHPKGHRHRVRGVPGNKRVVDALPGLGEAGYPPKAPQGLHGRPSSGEELVDIALVPHVEDQPVPSGVKDPVEGHGDLHRPQVGGQVPPGPGDHVQEPGAQAGAQGLRLPVADGLPIGHLFKFCQAHTSRPTLGHQRKSQEPQKPMATPSTAPAKTWMGVWPSSSLSSFPKSSGFISVQCSIM